MDRQLSKKNKMALLNKIRKDIKKSSYYVWFLGAQESKGLRGAEYIIPVLRNLIQREKTVEPFKITLQVSHKGLKIVQNLSNLTPKKTDSKPNKNDVIKHVIPHHAVTSVYQEEDMVACVLLLYNPVTRCPVHVHAYRCDTVETATLLTQQLSTLIERPENQRKLSEIETRLRAKGLLLPTVPRVNIPKRLNSCGSDGRSTTTSPASESSGGSSGGGQERLSHLYDSLAAELREKLGMSTDGKAAHAPILLPPRDYDTVHRQKGNLTGIELRRCLNENITGKTKPEIKEMERKGAKGNRLGRILGSSGGSSGIGSDHPPSPEQNGRFVGTHSTSDEEWAEHPSEDSMFVVEGEARNRPWKPEAKRSSSPLERDDDSPGSDSAFRRSEDNLLRERDSSPMVQKPREETLFRNPNHWSTPNLNIPIENFRKRNEKGNMSPVGVVVPRRRTSEEKRPAQFEEADSYKKRIPGYKDKRNEDHQREEPKLRNKGRLPDGTMKLSPQERFLDAKTKFLLLEKERLEEQEKNLQNIEKKRHSQVEAPISPEIIKTRPHWSKEDKISAERAGLVRRNSFFDDEPITHHLDERRGIPIKREDVVTRKKKLSRSDSRGPYYSQDRLNTVDNNYDPKESEKMVRTENKPMKNLQKRKSYEEMARVENIRHYEQDRRYYERGERRDFERSIDQPRYRPSRDEYLDQPRRSSREHRRTPQDGYPSPPSPPSEEEDRWADRKYSDNVRRRYSEDRDSPTPPRSRYEENEARRYNDRYKSPLRRSTSRGREDVVPYEREKGKYQALENEKRLNSNALAKEFKRKSYQEQFDKVDVAKGRGFLEQELDERHRGGYIDEESDRRKEFYARSEAKKQERRLRVYSYDDEEEPRRSGYRFSGGGHQHMWDGDRLPGLDRGTGRISHIKPDSYNHPEEVDRFVEAGGRLSQVQVDKLPARYRHSFVDQGGLGLAGRGHDLLQRTNSSVSSNRVGIAAVNPY